MSEKKTRKKSAPRKKPKSSEAASIATDQAHVLHLPFDGELKASAKKKYRETIIFVHHYGGSKNSVQRHVQLVNELGFDAVVFNLLYNNFTTTEKLPISADLQFGARHLWAQQVEAILNGVPGKKIIFSFSMPSCAALEAMARRQARDVSAWICDGGPFLQLAQCTWNLYQHHYEVKSKTLRAALTGLSYFLLGPGLKKDLRGYFRQMPSGFPVLSIASGSDPLVPREAIEEFFAQQDQVDVREFLISDAGHLEGLKLHPAEYKAEVREFLAMHAGFIGHRSL